MNNKSFLKAVTGAFSSAAKLLLGQSPKSNAASKVKWRPAAVANYIAVGKEAITNIFGDLDAVKSKAYFQTIGDEPFEDLSVSFIDEGLQSTQNWPETYIAELKKHIPQYERSLPKDKDIEKAEGYFTSAIYDSDVENAQHGLNVVFAHRLSLHKDYASLVHKVSGESSSNYDLSLALDNLISNVDLNALQKEFSIPQTVGEFATMNVKGFVLRSVSAINDAFDELNECKGTFINDNLCFECDGIPHLDVSGRDNPVNPISSNAFKRKDIMKSLKDAAINGDMKAAEEGIIGLFDHYRCVHNDFVPVVCNTIPLDGDMKRISQQQADYCRLVKYRMPDWDDIVLDGKHPLRNDTKRGNTPIILAS